MFCAGADVDAAPKLPKGLAAGAAGVAPKLSSQSVVLVSGEALQRTQSSSLMRMMLMDRSRGLGCIVCFRNRAAAVVMRALGLLGMLLLISRAFFPD